MGISGEAGEVTDYIKKLLFHGHILDKNKMKEELGDVLWYIATIGTTVGLSLEDIAESNILKLKKDIQKVLIKKKVLTGKFKYFLIKI